MTEGRPQRRKSCLEPLSLLRLILNDGRHSPLEGDRGLDEDGISGAVVPSPIGEHPFASAADRASASLHLALRWAT
jgi:hypothetical protein